VYENAEVGRSLETFRATDPDQGGKSKVSYAIDRASDRRRQFAITQNGTVTIQRHLDREDTPRHQVNHVILVILTKKKLFKFFYAN
jgi:Cadherin domain